MANPDGQIPMNPDTVRAAEERFALMEAELQTLREQNETLMRELREQQSVAEVERLWGGPPHASPGPRFHASDGRVVGGTCRSGSKHRRTTYGREDGAA